MKRILLFLFFVFIIPIISVNLFFDYDKIISKIMTNNKNDTTIRVLKDGNVKTMSLEDYLVGVVSSEVPVYFEEEALKAQAVAARTYALKQIENNKNQDYDVTADVYSQVYQTDDELKNKWEGKYDEYINKIKNAVDKTKGEYITYNDDIIYAFFFSTSNGYTEDNKNVFGQDLPYLKSVDSSFDETETSSFLTTKEIDLKEFYSKLSIDYNEKINITDINKSESGRILSLKVNNNKFTGREFQQKLGLRSNDFVINQYNNIVKITTKGFGHGVGMSQYGANALAKQKKSYKDILKYYYTGTIIQKL